MYMFIYRFFIVLSCSIVVGTNLSQFICIGRFTAVSFQVLGHMKTILVLILGFIFFGKDGLKWHVILGMVIAIVGMIWYGNASSKSGGKERCNLSMPSKNAQKNAGLPESTESDEKV
ncbi:hypothetical protein EZV62_015038 [Acer yangbiense]|uniref:Sugar phosphate transporter domain-containing protein n=1 Tax=Acer yangbiense TaxID=1000413 RepID=A0A5C7HUC7_9ROSI|nr:hypothetical protein EZV62_015038 [Acer yangbiense]